jgi:hypothetical protein
MDIIRSITINEIMVSALTSSALEVVECREWPKLAEDSTLHAGKEEP